MCDGKNLDDTVFDVLFRDARTYNAWQDKDVSDETLKALHDVVKFGPTSANCSPMRVVFVKSDEAKARLKPHLDEGNVDKTMSAPVTAIIGQDMEFYEQLPKLFPHTDAKSWFVGNDDLIQQTAFRNSSLQGGYLILAARALGLDCGPMSGFDVAGVKAEFFADSAVEPNFLCNLGYGDGEDLFPRSPRSEFDEANSII
ncbi:MAG: malonic semialdehyde reductase [Pseudomonadota bacterium]